jgi:hypothetical protein
MSVEFGALRASHGPACLLRLSWHNSNKPSELAQRLVPSRFTICLGSNGRNWAFNKEA